MLVKLLPPCSVHERPDPVAFLPRLPLSQARNLLTQCHVLQYEIAARSKTANQR